MARWVFGSLSLLLTAVATFGALLAVEVAQEPLPRLHSIWWLILPDIAIFVGAAALLRLAISRAKP
jgi:hypothetical protein